jgi:hypothetical protein
MGIWPCKKVRKFVRNVKSSIIKSRFHCILNVFSTERITHRENGLQIGLNHLFCLQVLIPLFLDNKTLHTWIALRLNLVLQSGKVEHNCLRYGTAQVRAWYKYICSLNSITYSTNYTNIIIDCNANTYSVTGPKPMMLVGWNLDI